MGEAQQYEPGRFCWVELATTDAAAARSFYAPLFDWQTKDTPFPGGGSYTMIFKGNREVGGMYSLMPDQKSQAIPPHWLSYVAVETADAAAKQAETLGAKILKAPFDVMDLGRMAVLQDPTGAVFALWQTKQPSTVGVTNQPGTVCWNELLTTNTDIAARFYMNLFGWKPTIQPMAPGQYTMFSLGAQGAQGGDRPVAGMLTMAKDWGTVPPNWLVYFCVENCDQSVSRAKSAGAGVIAPPSNIPSIGRFSVLHDPQGAVFALIQLAAGSR